MIFDDNEIRKSADIEYVKNWFKCNCNIPMISNITNEKYVDGKLCFDLSNSNTSLIFKENVIKPDFIVNICDLDVYININQINLIPNICLGNVWIDIDIEQLDELDYILSHEHNRKSIRTLILLVSTDMFNGYVVNKLSQEESDDLYNELKSKFTSEYFKSFNIIIGKEIKIRLV